MFAVLRTDGEMRIGEVFKECKAGKWAPLFAYTRKEDNVTVVPFFHQEIHAKTFAKRNLPAKWVHGAVKLTALDLEWIKQQGWIIEIFDFPRKLKDLTEIEMGLVILEFQEEPEVNGIYL